MKMIVGLGNPGKEYQNTRHNIGFRVLDRLAEALECQLKKKDEFQAEFANGAYEGEKYILIKPLTFMNLSGIAVKKAADYYKIEPKDIWVVADDLDLPAGRIRIRQQGSSGGHNGLQSIIDCIGTDELVRIRLGIGEYSGEAGESEKPESPIDAAKYVLQPFSKRENKVIEDAIERAVDYILQSLRTRQIDSHTL